MFLKKSQEAARITVDVEGGYTDLPAIHTKCLVCKREPIGNNVDFTSDALAFHPTVVKIDDNASVGPNHSLRNLKTTNPSDLMGEKGKKHESHYTINTTYPNYRSSSPPLSATPGKHHQPRDGPAASSHHPMRYSVSQMVLPETPIAGVAGIDKHRRPESAGSATSRIASGKKKGIFKSSLS